MKHRLFFVNVVLLLALVLAACIPATGGSGTMQEKGQATNTMMEEATHTPDAMMEEGTTTPDTMMDKEEDAMMEATHTPDAMMDDKEDAMMEATHTPDAMMAENTATPDAMMDKEEDSMMESAAWLATPLTDVVSGESFTLQDMQGKVVLVETMAVWCSTCKRQQMEIQALHGLLGDMADEVVSVSIDIDPNENAGQLKTYVEQNGFDWHYAVASREVAAEIGKLYGDQFLNPPSAPMLIIDRDGKVHPLKFGVKSAADLKMEVDALLKAGM